MRQILKTKFSELWQLLPCIDNNIDTETETSINSTIRKFQSLALSDLASEFPLSFLNNKC